MKAFTDISQSKKLAEILPLESADMVYIASANDDIGDILYTAEYKSEIILMEDDADYINCWSLAALLGILPKNLDIGRPVLATNYRGGYWVVYFDEYMKETNLTSKIYDNPIDACYEMIIKLHEQKTL